MATQFGQFEVGVMSFFPHSENSWLLGKVEQKDDDGNVNIVLVDEDGEVVGDGVREEGITTESLAPVVEGSLDTIKDLIDMPYLHEAVLLHHIRKRYWEDYVFSNIGPIVLALNPYNFNIPHYTDENMINYIEESSDSLHSASKQITHIWSVAHEAYWSMRKYDKPQSILVSGESGAGKTEAAKIVANYLAKCSTHFSAPDAKEAAIKITNQVVATSPILEAFGNAKTARNDNSSRFGKFMTIKFDSHGTLIGTHTRHYLLEKSRIITHADLERSFHTYYQLVSGCKDPEQRERYQLDHQRITWIYSGYEPTEEEQQHDAEGYDEVRNAMTILGLSDEEQTAVYDTIAGVLHFQGLQISETDDHHSFLEDCEIECLQLVASLWNVSYEELRDDILTTSTTLRGETIVKKLSAKQSVELRDGLSKALYERLFSCLIDKINDILHVDDDKAHDPALKNQWIGLLDIFGFENFAANSLEQLCINLANEQLQNHYNACVFARDLVEYEKEGIDTTTLNPPDNSATLNLIRGKASIIDHLNDTCRQQNSNDDSFLTTLGDAFSKKPGDKTSEQHPRFLKKKICDGRFGVKHYASDVWYTVDGFRAKNLDTLKDAFKTLMRDSGTPLIASLMPEPVDEAASPTSKKKITTTTGFRQSLDELVTQVDSTNPHWIRCVKPHSAKKPRMFSGNEVMEQLRCAGVLETIKIRQSGYSMRVEHISFFKRFCVVLDTPDQRKYNDLPATEGCQALLDLVCDDASKSGQIGKTKVFLKDVPYKLLEKKRDGALEMSGILVQTFARTRIAVQLRKVKEMMKLTRQVQSFARAKTSCHQRYYRDLLQKCRTIQAFSRTKLSYNERHIQDLKCKIILLQNFARAKQSNAKRAQQDLLRILREVQSHARFKESSRIVAKYRFQHYVNIIQMDALTKLSYQQVYNRTLQKHIRLIQSFSSSAVSGLVLKQKQREYLDRLTAAATLISSHMRSIQSVELSGGKKVAALEQELADKIAAEEAAREKAEQERLAAEEAARKAQEEAEAAAEQERLAAEEAARKEQEEAELAAEEAARKEQEEAKLAAEEEERKAQEEADAAAEEERLAAEEASRKAQEEADAIAHAKAEEERLEAEEQAQKQAAVASAKAEEMRLAAEEVAKKEQEEEVAASENVTIEETNATKAGQEAEKSAEVPTEAAKELETHEAADNAETAVASEQHTMEQQKKDNAAQQQQQPKNEVQVPAPVAPQPHAVQKPVESPQRTQQPQHQQQQYQQQQKQPASPQQPSAGGIFRKFFGRVPMVQRTQDPTPVPTPVPLPQVVPPVVEMGSNDMVKELNERRRQLESLASQLSEAMNEQEELRKRVAKEMSQREIAENALAVETKLRTAAEERVCELEAMRTGEELTRTNIDSNTSEDPEILQKMIAAKKATLKQSRSNSDHLESEILQLEKRRLFCMPLEDDKFHDLVATHTHDVTVKSRVRENRPRSNSLISAKDFTIEQFLQMLQDAQASLSPLLPPAVSAAVAKLVKEITSAPDDSGGGKTTLCLNKVQSMALVEPLLRLLDDIAHNHKEIELLDDTDQSVSGTIGNLKALLNGKNDITEEREIKMALELQQAREKGFEKLRKMAELKSQNAGIQESLKSMRNEISKLSRHALKQHRAEHQDSLNKIESLSGSLRNYSDGINKMLSQEEERGAEISCKATEFKNKIAAKSRDIEKDRSRVSELETSLLQNQRQNSYYHELVVAVKKRIADEKVEFLDQASAHKVAALLKVKQIAMTEAVETPLSEMLDGSVGIVVNKTNDLHQQMLTICDGEWNLLLKKQKKSMSLVNNMSSQLQDDSAKLNDLETSETADPSAAKQQRQQISNTSSQMKKELESIKCIQQSMNAIESFIKSHETQYPQDVVETYQISTMEWPTGSLYSQFLVEKPEEVVF